MSDDDLYRSFCPELEADEHAEPRPEAPAEPQPEAAAQCRAIREALVGHQAPFETPFGSRPLIYADWTASGRALRFVEDYLAAEVLPWYGNTHTTSSVTGMQSTMFRHEARQIVAESVNAKITGRGAEDVVLFTGSGSTGAIAKTVRVLQIAELARASADGAKPVVFVGPHEHHSNLLPWREAGAEVVNVPEAAETGLLDVAALEALLAAPEFADRPVRVGSFSACSNVTGALVDTDRVTALLHRHGALAFWDYAAAAPYVRMDMNPVVVGDDRPLVAKDAMFVSTHKFVGGPNTPGVLVIKKRLLANAVPAEPGGGTVFYVTDRDHRYLSNRSEREEGGTPDVVGSIRAGLAFRVKAGVGAEAIERLEAALWRRARASLLGNPRVVLLGPTAEDAPRLPILSFLVRFQDRFLHYNFVCALLNDLFGIQARGGCQCAGPYGQRLLGISPEGSERVQAALIDKHEVLRPGFARLSLPYFVADDEADFVLRAIHFVADHGWRLLPQYRFNHKTGEWKHKTRFTRWAQRRWLSRAPLFGNNNAAAPAPAPAATDFDAILAEARRITDAGRAEQCASEVSFGDDLMWFAVPDDGARLLREGAEPELRDLPASAVVRPPAVTSAAVPETEAEAEAAPAAPVAPIVAAGTTKISAPNQWIQTGLETMPLPAPGTATATAGAEESKDDKDKEKYPRRSGAEAPAAVPLPGVVAAAASKQARAQLFPKVPPKLMRTVVQAMHEWDMIKEGDRVMLGLSGGKDSLTLLHVLLACRKKAPFNYEIACCTVDPQTPSFDPSPLIPYVESLGVPYFYIRDAIVERAEKSMSGDSLCAFCSRMKRGILYTTCRREGYNKLVLAQHLDDLAESMFMSAMRNGEVRTMKACYTNSDDDVTVIRPLAYTRESATKKFAYDARLPIINENCPACFEEPKERHRVKKMLAREESLFPQLFSNLKRALVPFMDDSVYAQLQQVQARCAERRKNPTMRKQGRRAQPKGGKRKRARVEGGAGSSSSAGESGEAGEAGAGAGAAEEPAAAGATAEPMEE